ncbi:MAG: Uma2 family endonuclease [Gammaproteobacteria bacterium]
MSVAMEDLPRRHGITVDEYYHMAEVGELAPDARVELIEGEIIDMPPIGSPHGAMDSKLTALLVQTFAPRAIVRCGLPIRLDNMSEPQPDFALVLPRADFYEQRHPTAAETLLAIEVSDTRLSFDLGRKRALYARHGVAELWVIDLKRGRLHLFRRPSGNEYLEVSALNAPPAMSIESLPDITLDLSSVFGR